MRFEVLVFGLFALQASAAFTYKNIAEFAFEDGSTDCCLMQDTFKEDSFQRFTCSSPDGTHDQLCNPLKGVSYHDAAIEFMYECVLHHTIGKNKEVIGKFKQVDASKSCQD